MPDLVKPLRGALDTQGAPVRAHLQQQVCLTHIFINTNIQTHLDHKFMYVSASGSTVNIGHMEWIIEIAAEKLISSVQDGGQG